MLIEREEKRRKEGIEIVSELAKLASECGEKEEMRVGDIVIAKEPVQCVGCFKYHDVYQINEQDGDMVCVTYLNCTKKYLDHKVPKNDYRKYVKYTINFDSNTYSFWKDKDTLYKEYETFNKNKTHEL